MEQQAVRKVANIYEDTRELLNEVKEVFDFKSDDQAIRYMSSALLNNEEFKLIREYIAMKKTKTGAN